MSIQDTLQERAKTHGDFDITAHIIQDLKALFRETPNWMGGELTEREMESLDSIAIKLGRILTGNPHEADHWRDGAGYFTLGGGWKP